VLSSISKPFNTFQLGVGTLDGDVEVFMTECKGESFLYPNDLCFVRNVRGLFVRANSKGPFPQSIAIMVTAQVGRLSRWRDSFQ
jgi:hypothetical protein